MITTIQDVSTMEKFPCLFCAICQYSHEERQEEMKAERKYEFITYQGACYTCTVYICSKCAMTTTCPICSEGNGKRGRDYKNELRADSLAANERAARQLQEQINEGERAQAQAADRRAAHQLQEAEDYPPDLLWSIAPEPGEQPR